MIGYLPSRELKVSEIVELKLNLGCGAIHMPGYINIDGYPTESRGTTVSAADRHMMIEDLDYPENSVDQIICIHTLEHLTQAQVEKALLCWYRCLKPGGVLIIEVPDAEAIMERLLTSRSETEKDLYYYLLYGTQEFEGEHHRMGHTYARLSRMLEPVGFEEFVDGKKSSDKIADPNVYQMFRPRRWRAVLMQCRKPLRPAESDVERLRDILYFRYTEQDLKTYRVRLDSWLIRIKDAARRRGVPR